jgi:[acyl-carrier-protein] S-malonyltransferase
MGADLAAHSAAARSVFDLADELLGTKISTLCFYGPEETLRETINTQPALFVTSIAALRALEEAGAPAPEAVAGHSIGEYAALVASGAISFEVGLHLVVRRAQEMHRAATASPGAMAAVLGLAADDVAAVCAEAEAQTGKPVDAANFNGGGQVVISGDPDAVAKASELAKEKGAKRAIALNVSGAFHSRLMKPAAESMAHVLADAAINAAGIPVVANLTADYERDPEEIRRNLAAQIDHSVRWEETIARLVGDGFDTFVEVGAGEVLSGLLKRLAPDARRVAAGTAAGVASAVSLGGAVASEGASPVGSVVEGSL